MSVPERPTAESAVVGREPVLFCFRRPSKSRLWAQVSGNRVSPQAGLRGIEIRRDTALLDSNSRQRVTTGKARKTHEITISGVHCGTVCQGNRRDLSIRDQIATRRASTFDSQNVSLIAT